MGQQILLIKVPLRIYKPMFVQSMFAWQPGGQLKQPNTIDSQGA